MLKIPLKIGGSPNCRKTPVFLFDITSSVILLFGLRKLRYRRIFVYSRQFHDIPRRVPCGNHNTPTRWLLGARVCSEWFSWVLRVKEWDSRFVLVLIFLNNKFCRYLRRLIVILARLASEFLENLLQRLAPILPAGRWSEVHHCYGFEFITYLGFQLGRKFPRLRDYREVLTVRL